MTVLSVVQSVSWSICLFVHPPTLLSLVDPLPPCSHARSMSLFYALSALEAFSCGSLRHPLDSTTKNLFFFWERLFGGGSTELRALTHVHITIPSPPKYSSNESSDSTVVAN